MKRHASQRALAREHSEPQERHRPVPVAVLLVAIFLLAWAIVYICTTLADDAPELGDQRSPALQEAGSAVAGKVDGAQIYAANCVACHQASGQGLPGVFPPLAGSEWVLAKAEVPVNIVLHGINGKLTVLGQAFNGQMPSFKDKLSDAELAAVLSFVRSNFGNGAAALTPEQVAAARAASQERQTAWRGDEELNALAR